MRVFRNDEITVAEAIALNPEKVLVSPGPCTPKEAGVSCDIIREFGPRLPLFGVCLGHQALGDVYGGKVIRADKMGRPWTTMTAAQRRRFWWLPEHVSTRPLNWGRSHRARRDDATSQAPGR